VVPQAVGQAAVRICPVYSDTIESRNISIIYPLIFTIVILSSVITGSSLSQKRGARPSLYKLSVPGHTFTEAHSLTLIKTLYLVDSICRSLSLPPRLLHRDTRADQYTSFIHSSIQRILSILFGPLLSLPLCGTLSGSQSTYFTSGLRCLVPGRRGTMMSQISSVRFRKEQAACRGHNQAETGF